MTVRRTWPPPREPEEDFPAFDDTLTTGIEDTVRNLQVLTDRSRPGGSQEWQRYQLDAFRDLTKEVQELRKEVARIHETQRLKASKGAQEKFEKELAAKFDKKVQNLWKYAAGPLFAIAAVVCGKVFL